MWGWGAMNAGAVSEAVRTRYPMDQFFGIWWSGHDGDLAQAGGRPTATARSRGTFPCPTRP